MGNPYTPTTVSGYNNNPPPDDGSVSPQNRATWAGIKTKIGDPLNNFAAAINAALIAAFSKIVGGAGIRTINADYNVIGSDQGALIRATVANITITTPNASVVGAPFVFSVVNDTSGDIVLDGFDDQTIDSAVSVTIPARSGMTINTDGTNWFSGGQNFQRTQVFPQGYLTLVPVATNPVSPLPTADVLGAIKLFYRPFRGNLLPISNGVIFAIRGFSELELNFAAQHVASAIYDVFAFEDPDEAGTIRVGTGPAWVNPAAGAGSRGSGVGTSELIRLNGLLVNTNAITMRNGADTYTVAALAGTYLGSIHMDGTAGQVTCHVSYGRLRKWGVWNAYNRLPLALRAGDPASSWSLGSALGPINASADNKATVFRGLAEEWIKASYRQTMTIAVAAANSASGGIAIGRNSTTVASGKRGDMAINNSNAAQAGMTAELEARLSITPALGIDDLQMLEHSNNAVIKTSSGAQTGNEMLVEWMG